VRFNLEEDPELKFDNSSKASEHVSQFSINWKKYKFARKCQRVIFFFEFEMQLSQLT
jgi:hypothetical protein